MPNKAARRTSAGKGRQKKPGPNVKKYDFRHPKLVSKEIMRGLYKIHNRFARNTRRIFSNALNLDVDVTLRDIKQVTTDEFLTSLTTPTALFLLNIKELSELAILQIDPSFCTFFVEYQSGGRSMNLEKPRGLTRIEERVMGRIVDKMLEDLTRAWSPYIKMSCLSRVYEGKPTNVRAISYIPAIKITFKLNIEHLEVPFRICYPYAQLKEEIINSTGEFNTGNKEISLSEDEGLQFKNEMKQVNITAHALLGETKVPFRQLLGLSEGDLIRLDQHINDPLAVKVNKKSKMLGYPGTINGKKAVKIFDFLKEE